MFTLANLIGIFAHYMKLCTLWKRRWRIVHDDKTVVAAVICRDRWKHGRLTTNWYLIRDKTVRVKDFHKMNHVLRCYVFISVAFLQRYKTVDAVLDIERLMSRQVVLFIPTHKPCWTSPTCWKLQILTALCGLGHAESMLSIESSAPVKDRELLLLGIVGGVSAAIVTFSSTGLTLRGLPGPRPVPLWNDINRKLSWKFAN